MVFAWAPWAPLGAPWHGAPGRPWAPKGAGGPLGPHGAHGAHPASLAHARAKTNDFSLILVSLKNVQECRPAWAVYLHWALKKP